ncbi:glutamate carboxypeptidase II [Pestalotiopsis sp. NC0098]|nr:glutamate carboxypeptidase II [Pestalotiopsis sp. NC0098]
MHTLKALGSIALLATSADACLHARHKFDRHHHVKRQITLQTPLTPNEETLVGAVSTTTLDEWSYYYTHGAHLAGTNLSMAQWTADRWAESGLNSTIIAYDVFINYPLSKGLSLTYANGTVYQPSLEEAVLEADETTSYPNRIPTFNGYSASGNATAEYVYIGRGQKADFDRLEALGVPLEGKIAISRYGGPFRGLKVKNAQEHGMLGVVLFTDTADDGDITEANGYAAYPDGPARNPTSVQRGSVEFLSIYPGDPTTPDYPSKEGVPRTDGSAVLPHIPSVPISWLDAQPILAALDGAGTDGAQVNRSGWVGALNVSYSTGPAPGVQLSLSNQMNETITPLWDAIGVINGTCADETIVIGNHRDAWIVGGAADPNSGTAIIVELAKAFGELLQTGWRPRRNIVLGSWDGEEYGLLGSTEFVEEYLPWLNDTAISYLNVDIGASGPHVYFDASPELHYVTQDTMKKIMWMDQNRTMYDVWYEDLQGEIGVLGSGSDYTAFVHKGIGALDIGASGFDEDPIYHYHSNYDSYHWMTTFGDPGFLAHKSMTQFMSLLAYSLADATVIPFNLTNYAVQLDAYYDDLQATINETATTLDTDPLRSAIDDFAQSALELEQQAGDALGADDAAQIDVVNHKYRDFQRGFVSQGGLPGREFFKHLIFAPGADTGYAAVTFPGITEAVEAGNFSTAADFVTRTAAAITAAADIIRVS